MYAVIETGGKQYRVEVGTELEVEKLDAEPGSSITIDRVLLVADGDEAAIGRPVVENAAVSAEVVRQGRGDKVISFKYRPKARRRVKKGHRQDLTILRITDVRLGSKSAADAAKQAEAAAKTERQRLEEAAAKQAAADAALAAKLAKDTEAKSGAAKKTTAGKASTEAKAKAETRSKASTAKADDAAPRKATRAKATDAAASADDKPAPKRPRSTKKGEDA
jgi:large subunit ribosomal protein L21